MSQPGMWIGMSHRDIDRDIPTWDVDRDVPIKLWDIPIMKVKISYGISLSTCCMGYPIYDLRISHSMYMGYLMGCPTLSMAYLVKSFDLSFCQHLMHGYLMTYPRC